MRRDAARPMPNHGSYAPCPCSEPPGSSARKGGRA
jgi:hypothetical protein